MTNEDRHIITAVWGDTSLRVKLEDNPYGLTPDELRSVPQALTSDNVESFNARFRDELLNREVFYSLREAQIIIKNWRKHYNTKRPHSALGYRPPAPETIVPIDQRPIMH